ncbi:hypothetical protein [Nocardiopsis sp. FIRDI 009]|uniref:hypothetical protein n=1 Tax=Nocardiopsis sp. FIRDI 009 TaxID=714197 RepID=UPI000E229DCC|nr:hypothetical protein [Nocardiopsis sp. FIRDI 009]
MNPRTYTICAIALALAVSGCGTTGDGSTAMNETTITQDQAATKVQEHIDAALTALPEEAELETRRGTLFAACDDPTDGGSRDRVTVSETFWIRGLPVEDNEANIELMHEYWTGNGYRVMRDERPDSLSVTVEHEEDSFRVGVRTSDEGSLSISASSPCVWPEGTPSR